jgi:membrane-bound lytic murein transglycosylase B
VYDPGDAIPAAAGYLCDHGAPRRLDAALYAYNHSWAYVARVKRLARGYVAPGGGRR